MSDDTRDEALEWDDREDRGTENEHFTRPSSAIIEFARANYLRMNLWSRAVQKMIQLRIQHGWTTPTQQQSVDWLPWWN